MSPANLPQLVVKLGGSLMRAAPPRLTLQRLSRASGVILVPGGGALADAVRDAQPQWGLSDAASHRMALLAMEQMAHALLDLAPDFRPCRRPEDFRTDVACLWFPATMMLGAPGIAESWDVTSDSLALWLAKRLHADRLVLVKAAEAELPPPSGHRRTDLVAWTAAGLVDAAFVGMAAGFEGDILLVAADDAATLDEALSRPAAPDPAGTR